jgi:hypothetical protein
VAKGKATVEGGQARTLSRARAAEVDGIVAGIVDLMVTGGWVAGLSHRELAEQHKVSVERVKDWATEAGRTLRILSMVDKDELRARNQARLDAIASTAYAAGEYGDAVRAVSEQNKLLGLNAPERHEHAHVVAKYEQMQPTERAEWLRERARLMLEEADRLDDAGRD